MRSPFHRKILKRGAAKYYAFDEDSGDEKALDTAESLEADRKQEINRTEVILKSIASEVLEHEKRLTKNPITGSLLEHLEARTSEDSRSVTGAEFNPGAQDSRDSASLLSFVRYPSLAEGSEKERETKESLKATLECIKSSFKRMEADRNSLLSKIVTMEEESLENARLMELARKEAEEKAAAVEQMTDQLYEVAQESLLGNNIIIPDDILTVEGHLEAVVAGETQVDDELAPQQANSYVSIEDKNEAELELPCIAVVGGETPFESSEDCAETDKDEKKPRTDATSQDGNKETDGVHNMEKAQDTPLPHDDDVLRKKCESLEEEVASLRKQLEAQALPPREELESEAQALPTREELEPEAQALPPRQELESEEQDTSLTTSETPKEDIPELHCDMNASTAPQECDHPSPVQSYEEASLDEEDSSRLPIQADAAQDSDLPPSADEDLSDGSEGDLYTDDARHDLDEESSREESISERLLVTEDELSHISEVSQDFESTTEEEQERGIQGAESSFIHDTSLPKSVDGSVMGQVDLEELERLRQTCASLEEELALLRTQQEMEMVDRTMHEETASSSMNSLKEDMEELENKNSFLTEQCKLQLTKIAMFEREHRLRRFDEDLEQRAHDFKTLELQARLKDLGEENERLKAAVAKSPSDLAEENTKLSRRIEEMEEEKELSKTKYESQQNAMSVMREEETKLKAKIEELEKMASGPTQSVDSTPTQSDQRSENEETNSSDKVEATQDLEKPEATEAKTEDLEQRMEESPKEVAEETRQPPSEVQSNERSEIEEKVTEVSSEGDHNLKEVEDVRDDVAEESSTPGELERLKESMARKTVDRELRIAHLEEENDRKTSRVEYLEGIIRSLKKEDEQGPEMDSGVSGGWKNKVLRRGQGIGSIWRLQGSKMRSLDSSQHGGDSPARLIECENQES